MKLIDKFVIREVGGKAIAVPTGKASTKFKGFIQLNNVSKAIFEFLMTDISKEQLVEEMLKIFDVEKDVAEKDIDEFLEQLKGANILED